MQLKPTEKTDWKRVGQRWLYRAMVLSVWLHTTIAFAQNKQIKALTKAFTKMGVKSTGAKGPQRKVVMILFAIAIAGVIGLVMWLRNRKAKKAEEAAAAGAGAAPEPAAETAPVVQHAAPLAETALKKVWDRFTKSLRQPYRRSLQNFQPIIVFGAANSGKTRNITNYTDWEEQHQTQHLETSEPDPDLQIYLGTRAVVLETPAKILHDSSEAARGALARLWKQLCKNRSPIAVATVDVVALSKAGATQARRLGLTLRGKINALAATRGKAVSGRPIELRLVLTHLDEIPGYKTFARFAREHRIPLRLTVDPRPVAGRASEEALEEAILASFQDLAGHASLALTKLDAREYQDVLEFLEKAPAELRSLGTLVSALHEFEPRSDSPSGGEIYLGVDAHVSPSSNPFHVTDAQLAERYRPVSWHLVAATAAALIFGGLQLWSFANQRPLYMAAAHATRGAGPKLWSKTRRAKVLSFTHASSLLDFYGEAKPGLEERVASNIRDNVLVKRLRRAQRSTTGAHRKTLYYLALLHATEGTPLAKLVRGLELSQFDLAPSRASRSTRPLRLKADVRDDYIATSMGADPQVINLPTGGRLNLAFDSPKWIGLLREIESTIDSESLSDQRLSHLKASVNERMDELEIIESSKPTADLLRFLEELPDSHYRQQFGKYVSDLQSPDLDTDVLHHMRLLMQEIHLTKPPEFIAVEDLHQFVQVASELLEAQGGGMVHRISFPKCFLVGQDAMLGGLQHTQVSPGQASGRDGEDDADEGDSGDAERDPNGATASAAAASEEDASEVDKCEEIGLEFTIDSGKWWALAREMQLRALVTDFKGQFGESAHRLFFPKGEVLAPAIYNPGAALGSEISLPGAFTRVAFDTHVRPVLSRYVDIHARLDSALRTEVDGDALDGSDMEEASDKQSDPRLAALDKFVLDSMQRYSREWLGQLATFYSRYDVRFCRAVRDGEYSQGFPRCGGKSGGVSEVPSAFERLSRRPSELTYFLDIVAENSRLEVTGEKSPLLRDMLLPMDAVDAYYAPIHRLVIAEGGDPTALDEYISYIARAALEMTTLPIVAPPSPRDELGARVGMLPEHLSPIGLLGLKILKKEPDNLAKQVESWVHQRDLDRQLGRPFRLPIQALKRAGAGEISDVVAAVWQQEVLRDLKPLLNKFPFNPAADEEVLASELEAVFNPVTGQIADRYNRFLANVSLSTVPDGPIDPALRLPKALYRVLRRTRALATTLWDDKGVPKIIELPVKIRPFGAVRDPGAALTLAYMNLGSTEKKSSVFNFNQTPSLRRLEFDWTRMGTSQIGIQLTNAYSGEQVYPQGIIAGASHFSHLRLLARAVERGVRAQGESNELRLWRWQIKVNRGGKEHIEDIEFLVGRDPWQVFELRDLVFRQPNAETDKAKPTTDGKPAKLRTVRSAYLMGVRP